MSAKTVAERVAKGIIYALLAFILLFFLLLITARDSFIIEIPVRVLFGWLIYLWNSLPQFLAKWHTALISVVFLMVAAVIGHRCIRFWLTYKFPARTWHLRHTVGVLALLLLVSAAAIAVRGAVQQLIWLTRGELTKHRGASERAMISLHARNLGQAASSYHHMNGHYPDSITELYREFFGKEVGFPHWETEGGVIEPVLFLHPGRKDALSADEVMVVSPAFDYGRYVVVVMGNGKTEMVAFDELGNLIKRTQYSREIKR
jgi:hypothetical protein